MASTGAEFCTLNNVLPTWQLVVDIYKEKRQIGYDHY